MTNQAPNVGAIVAHGTDAPELYRVTGWLKPRPARFTGYERAISGAPPAERSAQEVFEQFLYGVLLPNEPRRPALIYCRREEATHLALCSEDAIVAPVEACLVIGQVDWSQDLQRKAVGAALDLAQRSMPAGVYA